MVERPSRSALEFLGTLAGGLLHEIKNPLSTLSINLALLKEDLHVSLPAERALTRRVEALQSEVRRLDAILEEFQRYAGMRKMAIARHDLKVIVEEMVDFLRPGFSRDGAAIEVRTESLFCNVDAALFKQALLNLILNAQHALGDEGRVVVKGRREAGHAVLEVKDNGCGIPADRRERVFDVYYSASKAGSGLGLPTARRILEEHGGTLDLESEEGKGTCVRMTLPLAEGCS